MPLFRPGKPYRLFTVSGTPAAATGYTTVTWSAVDEDGEWGVGSDLTTSVVARAGLYAITGGWSRSSASGSSTTRFAVRINGVNVRHGWTPNVNAGAAACSAAILRQLDVGDQVEAQYQTGGGGVTDVAGCGLEIVRVGPVRWT